MVAAAAALAVLCFVPGPYGTFREIGITHHTVVWRGTYYGPLCNRADHYIFILFLSFFFLLLLFLTKSQLSEIGCLPYFGTWCGLSANLECWSEMRCTRLTENTGRKKSPSRHHRTTLSGHIFATKACIDNRKKNLLSSNTSSTCTDNMVNFSPLTAEIGSGVWGTPTNFDGFCVLAALLHGIW